MSEHGPVDPNNESASETTNIALPSMNKATEPSVIYTLSEDEKNAVRALPSGSALLIAHSGPNKGARFLLDTDESIAGRHPNADIFLDDVTVSRRHAKFTRTGENFLLSDIGSLNGTYINGDRIDEIQLNSGVQVQIGKFRLNFYQSVPNL
ncbi:FHA domain-containing protein [Glutamicibacter sp. JL.03c]|uniref:FHA domain-containing protein n=1 Tax=Glutamicibacter sp. JL.03c TaxID=2984842 RepID=UPI0021F78E0E|nr:FHA domain-containing protein [Glutamicibacter sp. JL.03c]UYQ78623.1 FHA domain-containing protein [Glutamicibacter sp. JL.03c]